MVPQVREFVPSHFRFIYPFNFEYLIFPKIPHNILTSLPVSYHPAQVMNTRMRGGQANTTLTPTPTSRLVRDHYVKMVHRMVLKDTMDLPAIL